MNRIARSLSLLAAATLTVGGISSLSGTQVSLAGLSTQTVNATAIASDEFGLDAVHSSVVFKIKHGGIGYFYGTFAGFDGKFRIDTENASNTMIDVSVETASVNSNNSRRDAHLKSPDFFNAEQFPRLSFKSTSAKAHDDGTIHVTGDLTYRGRTHSITVPVTKTGEGETRQGHRQGMHTEFKIKRSDFGDNWGIDNGALSDEVTLIVSLQGVRG